jgi:hypothetical protein
MHHHAFADQPGDPQPASITASAGAAHCAAWHTRMGSSSCTQPGSRKLYAPDLADPW